MNPSAPFLLIGRSGTLWQEVLQASLGKLDVMERKALDSHALNYKLYVIDATYVQDASNTVRLIRSKDPKARVLVVTSSPTWKIARDVLKAGAVDYVKKSLNKEAVDIIIQKAMEKMPPP
jgi:DNA-binding NtrC family response regulator